MCERRTTTPTVCTLEVAEDGEVVVWYPGGIRDATGLYPSDEELPVIEAFGRTTTGISLLMRQRKREIHDALTGLLLRAPGRALIHRRLAKIAARQYTGVASVLVLDLDYFGRYNKEYGQAVGDDVLRWFADTLSRMTRSQDIVVRWGGEEFVVFTNAYQTPPGEGRRGRDQRTVTDLGDTQTGSGDFQVLHNGRIVARRIWEATRETPCVIPGAGTFTQTVTIGVATQVITTELDTSGLFEELFSKADAKLAHAKDPANAEQDLRDKVHEADIAFRRGQIVRDE